VKGIEDTTLTEALERLLWVIASVKEQSVGFFTLQVEVTCMNGPDSLSTKMRETNYWLLKFYPSAFTKKLFAQWGNTTGGQHQLIEPCLLTRAAEWKFPIKLYAERLGMIESPISNERIQKSTVGLLLLSILFPIAQKEQTKCADSHNRISYGNVKVLTCHKKIKCYAKEPKRYHQAADFWLYEHKYAGSNFYIADNIHKTLWRQGQKVCQGRRQIFVPVG
jgi:hypothetical protein